jgi:hypothetical protein
LLLVFSVILFSGCAKVYYSPDAYSLANDHKTIAIAPPKVTIAVNKDVEAEAIKEQQRLESSNFQKEINSWLLRRKMQNKIFVEILDVETTNANLAKEGYFDGTPMTPNDICNILDVDAIITSNFALTKPMSEGAAVAIGVIAGVWGTTNSTKAVLEIHDRVAQKMIWSYNHEVSGSAGSSAAKLVDELMRDASIKMPYVRP